MSIFYIFYHSPFSLRIHTLLCKCHVCVLKAQVKINITLIQGRIVKCVLNVYGILFQYLLDKRVFPPCWPINTIQYNKFISLPKGLFRANLQIM